MFTRLFAAITIWFRIVESVGNSVHNVATVGEELSEAYLKQQRIDNRKVLARMEAEEAKEMAVLASDAVKPKATATAKPKAKTKAKATTEALPVINVE